MKFNDLSEPQRRNFKNFVKTFNARSSTHNPGPADLVPLSGRFRFHKISLETKAPQTLCKGQANHLFVEKLRQLNEPRIYVYICLCLCVCEFRPARKAAEGFRNEVIWIRISGPKVKVQVLTVNLDRRKTDVLCCNTLWIQLMLARFSNTSTCCKEERRREQRKSSVSISHCLRSNASECVQPRARIEESQEEQSRRLTLLFIQGGPAAET